MIEYFPPASPECPTFEGDSEWYPLIDGQDYFAELDENLRGLQPGDEVLVAGLELDADLDLAGRRPGEDGYDPLLDRLIALGGRGVDVRVLLAGKVSASWFRVPALAEFRRNRAVVVGMDAALPGHALVDYSGPLLGSNHQKTVVVTRRGDVTAFVGGIDLVAGRLDTHPHDRMELDGRRWGWHDAAVRLRGPAAGRAHDVYLRRWHEAASLPQRRWFGRGPRTINPHAAPTPEVAREQKPLDAGEQVSVRVLRSIAGRKLGTLLPWRRVQWDAVPRSGVQEIHATLVHAIGMARRYVYIEDQYLHEYAGGDRRFELFGPLRDAAARGAKVILVGSGRRDPDDPGIYLRQINTRVNHDIARKILIGLTPERRDNVAVYRVEHATVHSKIVIVDDVFADIGSANLFSRSMAGVDSEISAAVATATPLVRDLRVRLWAEHLRAPLTPGLAADLENLDLALGIWDAAWLPADHAATTWREAGEPESFVPAERVLTRVDR